MPERRLMLLDTASLYFRAFHGIPTSVIAPDGTPVNAVRGLLDFVARLLTAFAPTHLAACWDDDWRPAWRVAAIPSYKAHRVAGPAADAGAKSAAAAGPAGEAAAAGASWVEQVPADLAGQVPVIRQVLTGLGIAVVGAAGCEADDVIGTLAARWSGPVDVVTGDRDLFQLVDDTAGVRVLYTARRGVRDVETVDEAAVRARYGVPAARYADFATLRGDPSDGLPGVAGIGEKTAAALVGGYGDLAALRAAAAAGAPGPAPLTARVAAAIRAAAGYLDVAPAVVRVRRDAPLPEADLAVPRTPADPAGFAALVARYGLGSPAARVRAALAGQAG